MLSVARGYPPGPRGHWLWGVSSQFQGDLLQLMINWMHEYGDAIRFRYFPTLHGYLFCHPNHYRHILQDNRQNYNKLPNPIYEILKTFGGKGLLTSDGALWARQRRLMQPAFHRQSISRFSTIMTEAATAMLARWEATTEQGQVVDIAEEMIRLALEVSGRSLFSIDLTREAKKIGEAFAAISSHFRTLVSHPMGVYLGRPLLNIPFLPSTRRFRHNVARLDEIVNKIIATRRQQRAQGQERRRDLLDLLMNAQDKETGVRMDDQQLRDEVMTLLLTSHETVAVTLAATFALLSAHPQVQAKLGEEVDSVLGGRTPTMDDIDALLYTTMVVKESLRLYPPVYATSRTAQTADCIDGYRVDANAIVTLSPYLTHRHPAFWPDPETFDPTRFAPTQTVAGPDTGYIPFGRGPRSCIGSHFAKTEVTLVVAMVAQRYRLNLQSGHTVKMKPLITLHPQNGVPVTLQKRE